MIAVGKIIKQSYIKQSMTEKKFFIFERLLHKSILFYYFRKFEQCRNSINVSSINCTGYEPYEYSWANNKTNGM